MPGQLHRRSERPGRVTGVRGIRVLLCLLVLTGLSAPCNSGQVSQGPTNSAQPKQSIINPAVNRPPDKNAQMEMQERNARKASYDKANTERMRQLTDDSEALLALATELKADMDKAPENALPSDSARRSEEIARLAHDVQVKMKLTVNAAY